MKRIVRMLMAGSIILAALAAASCTKKEAPRAQGRPAVAVETAVAAAGEVVDGIEVVGTLAPRVEAEVKSEISGRVAEVYVSEWARVRKGDPLARIDATETQAQLRRAEAATRAAGAALAAASAGSATAQAGKQTAQAAAETAKAALAEAKVSLDRAEREYNRVKGLKEAGLATQQALDEALTQKLSAEARIGTLHTQVASAESQVNVAETQVGAAQAQVASAEAQVAMAREETHQVESRLAKAVIRAPFDGTVAERLVNVGEVVGEMQKVIFHLVDNSLLDLTVRVPSQDMARVREGQELSFTTDAYPGRAFRGRVAHVNPSVDEADRSVRVTAEVPNSPEVLKGGLFVRGTIITGTRTGVIRVPRSALFNWDVPAGRADLYVVEGDQARLRKVGVGTLTADLAEIPEGLVEGARVVVRGGFNLRDGDRVSVAGAGA